MNSPESSGARASATFHSTQWSMVLRAGHAEDPDAPRALESLCERYWQPLYAYVRRRVSDRHHAQDLTQAFFAQILEKNLVERASPERGRFRSFLLTSLANFLASDRERAGAQKRGSGRRVLSLDFDSGESRLSLEPAHSLTPEKLFERHWALAVLDNVVSRLSAEFTAAGKERQFLVLKDALTGERPDYPSLAESLGQSEDAVRQAVHRLRKRYRELLREEVAQTVEDAADVDDELRRLFDSLG